MQTIQDHGATAADAKTTDRAFHTAQARSSTATRREPDTTRSTRDDDGTVLQSVDAVAMRRCIRAGLWP